jgi:hypothetical protein
MDEPAHRYWGSQAFVRLLFLFGLTSYSYLSKPRYGAGAYAEPSPGDTLKNDLIFTWSFMEMGFWFLIYLSLREEQRRSATQRT